MRTTTVTLVIAALLALAPAPAQAQVEIDVVPDGKYGTPCGQGSQPEPWEPYCDLKITGASDGACTKVSDTLNPPEPGSGSAVVRVTVGGDPAVHGDYTRNGCELWLHPDRIHQRLGPGSVGVRINWPMDQQIDLVVRGKFDGRDPQDSQEAVDEGVSDAPPYVAPESPTSTVDAVDVLYPGFDGSNILPCPSFTDPYGFVQQSAPMLVAPGVWTCSF